MKLSKLFILDLMNCEVTKLDEYRETVFQMLPQLKYLDNVDKEGGKIPLRRISIIRLEIFQWKRTPMMKMMMMMMKKMVGEFIFFIQKLSRIFVEDDDDDDEEEYEEVFHLFSFPISINVKSFRMIPKRV